VTATSSPPPRWAAFAAVGILGFAVQLATLAWLSHAGLPTAPAAAVAVEIALLHNFAWHDRLTWRDRAGRGPAPLVARLARFHATTGIVSLAGNVALTVAAVAWVHLPPIVANACAVTILSAVNFLIADRWVFTKSNAQFGGRSSA
jgi:putative flippase GtrA